MKIIVINEMKKYYDAHKIADVLSYNKNVTASWLHNTDEKVLIGYIEENNTQKIKEFLSNISISVWQFFNVLITQNSLFHIVYFTDSNKYHSKGVNVYATDMMSAVEKFVSEFGIEPFYCTVKEKQHEK